MKRSEAEAFTRSLMASSGCLYLATVDEEGRPQIRAVSNLRDRRQFPSLAGFFRELEDPFVTYVATSTRSSKAIQLRRDPRVALYFCKPEKYHGAMLSGSMEVVKDREVKRRLWQEEWRSFWSRGPADPRFTVLRFVPEEARGWSGEEQFHFALRAGAP